MNVLDYRIYSLNCPLTGAVRYIGYTSLDLESRLRMHINSCLKRDANTHRGKWINKLRRSNLRPIIKHLLDCTLETVKQLEVRFIAHYKQFCKLVNGTSGGDGLAGWVPTEEQRKSISKRNSRPNPGRRKPITLTNTENSEEKYYFKSCQDAAVFIKGTADAIRMVARGQRNSIFGFYCSYTTLT